MQVITPRAAAGLAAGLLCGPVLAQSLDEILAPRPDTAACWQRTYSVAHLAAHPLQKVTEVRFDLAYYEMDHHEAGKGSHSFSIHFKTREREGWNGGLCYQEAPGKVTCAVDCDGGALAIRSSGTQGALLVEMLSDGMTLSECGDDAPFFMSAEPDDRLFLVHPAACPTD